MSKVGTSFLYTTTPEDLPYASQSRYTVGIGRYGRVDALFMICCHVLELTKQETSLDYIYNVDGYDGIGELSI